MKLKIVFTGRLIFRITVAVICGLIYLKDSSKLDFSSENMWIGIIVVWFLIMIDFILRFIPGKMHPIGMQKHLRQNFIPTDKYNITLELSDRDREQKKKLDRGAIRVLVFYIFLNAIWAVLYILKIFRAQELFLIMLIYYVGDMICANGFCPFKLLFMKNRCCNVCRIYNWDALMLVIPLLIVPSLYSYSLGMVAIIYTIVWEWNYLKHPERFLEGCNEAITCKNCKHGICPKRLPWNK